MAPFPDNLPPEGMPAEYKLLIYYGILFVFATAFVSWLITRRRSFPEPEIVERDTSQPAREIVARSGSMTESLGFEDDHDRLASLIVEEDSVETALLKLEDLKASVSDDAYDKIRNRYTQRLQEIKAEIDEIQAAATQQSEDLPVDDVEAIEADLEKQLMDLENDDAFLKPRRKKSIDDIFEEDKKPEPAAPASSPVKAAAPKTPAPRAEPPKAAPPAARPAAESSIPAPSSKSEKKVPMPPAPGNQGSGPIPAPSSKKVAPPPPPGKPGSAPPSAKPPSASQPLSAAQPMKVETDQDDAMFSKSTSIAALRMDMLRELARLKKLIPEDQDND